MDIFFQLFGWLGALGLLVAFFLNSRQLLNSDSKSYQWMNFISAAMLMTNAYHIGSYPFIVINLFWAIVAFIALVKIHRNPKKKG